jgi:membrane protein
MDRVKVPLQDEAQEKVHQTEQRVNQLEVPMSEHMGLVDFGKQIFHQVGEDHIGAFAGNLAFQGLFAIFPFLIFLLSLLGMFHAAGLVKSVMDHAASTMPHDAVKFVGSKILSVAESRARGAFTLSAGIALLLALWGVSGGFRAVMEAVNVVYGVKDRRPFWKKYLISAVLALVSVLLFLAALILIVFGSAIGGAVAQAVGMGSVFRVTWSVVQWPVLLLFLLVAYAVIYYLAPDVQQRFRLISPGAVAGVALWVLFALAFSVYVNNFGTYNKVYGTLAGLAILLLFMYYSAFILLLGAEINQVVEEHAPAGRRGGERRSPNGDRTEASENPTLIRERRERDRKDR